MFTGIMPLYVQTFSLIAIDNDDTVDDVDISHVHLPPGFKVRFFVIWVWTVRLALCYISIHCITGIHPPGEMANVSSSLSTGQVFWNVCI